MNELERALRRSAPKAGEDAAAAAARFADQAADVDVAYALVDSPFGPIIAASTDRGLVRLSWQGSRIESVLAELAGEISPRLLESPARLDPIRRELDEYFEGKRKQFDAPVDYRLRRGFSRRVLRALARVPYGELVTYGELAAEAGNPRAARAVGNTMNANPVPIVVPCHRVIRSGGVLGGYGGGVEMKKKLLNLEGALDEQDRPIPPQAAGRRGSSRRSRS